MIKRQAICSWIWTVLLAVFSQPALGASETASAASLGRGFEDRYADVGDARIHRVSTM